MLLDSVTKYLHALGLCLGIPTNMSVSVKLSLSYQCETALKGNQMGYKTPTLMLAVSECFLNASTINL